jgi:hypothetical protein
MVRGMARSGAQPNSRSWPSADWQPSRRVSKKPTPRQRVTDGQVAVARNAGP